MSDAFSDISFQAWIHEENGTNIMRWQHRIKYLHDWQQSSEFIPTARDGLPSDTKPGDWVLLIDPREQERHDATEDSTDITLDPKVRKVPAYILAIRQVGETTELEDLFIVVSIGHRLTHTTVDKDDVLQWASQQRQVASDDYVLSTTVRAYNIDWIANRYMRTEHGSAQGPDLGGYGGEKTMRMCSEVVFSETVWRGRNYNLAKPGLTPSSHFLPPPPTSAKRPTAVDPARKLESPATKRPKVDASTALFEAAASTHTTSDSPPVQETPKLATKQMASEVFKEAQAQTAPNQRRSGRIASINKVSEVSRNAGGGRGGGGRRASATPSQAGTRKSSRARRTAGSTAASSRKALKDSASARPPVQEEPEREPTPPPPQNPANRKDDNDDNSSDDGDRGGDGDGDDSANEAEKEQLRFEKEWNAMIEGAQVAAIASQDVLWNLLQKYGREKQHRFRELDAAGGAGHDDDDDDDGDDGDEHIASQKTSRPTKEKKSNTSNKSRERKTKKDLGAGSNIYGLKNGSVQKLTKVADKSKRGKTQIIKDGILGPGKDDAEAGAARKQTTGRQAAASLAGKDTREEQAAESGAGLQTKEEQSAQGRAKTASTRAQTAESLASKQRPRVERAAGDLAGVAVTEEEALRGGTSIQETRDRATDDEIEAGLAEQLTAELGAATKAQHAATTTKGVSAKKEKKTKKEGKAAKISAAEDVRRLQTAKESRSPRIRAMSPESVARDLAAIMGAGLSVDDKNERGRTPGPALGLGQGDMGSGDPDLEGSDEELETGDKRHGDLGAKTGSRDVLAGSAEADARARRQTPALRHEDVDEEYSD